MLDISNYKFDHPGGLFLLQSNRGKDISKYFYGGYTFENYIPDKTPYTHTNLALRFAINNLAIGKLHSPNNNKSKKLNGTFHV